MQSVKVICGRFCNTYVVETCGGVIIVDAGVSVAKIKEAVGMAKVLAILVTHGHYDHIMFLNDYINEFSDCRIFASKECKLYFHNSEYNLCKGLDVKIDNERFVMLDKELGVFTVSSDGMAQTIEYMVAPGHSLDSIVYLIGENLFVGDLLFKNSFGRFDLPGGNALILKGSIELVCMNFADKGFEKCYSGHGESSSLSEFKDNIVESLDYLKYV